MRRRYALLHLTTIGLAALGACSKNEAAGTTAPAAPPPPKALNAEESQKAYQAAAAGNGFMAGSVVSANQVFVFFDPQCPHCAALWTSSQPLLRKLKMIWMPVGFLRRESTPQGALLLSAKDPVATMTEHEALLTSRKGGLPLPDKVDETQIAKVKANTALLEKLGADSVPFVLFRNAKTGVYGSHVGGMTTEQLAQMVGI
jgi:thiol:disulfide interchange protein DsbG